jgi:hypothetical protein
MATCSVRRMTVKPGWIRERERSRRRGKDVAGTEITESLWKWTEADRRLLIITFAGGIASIVVAAVIIGIAISFARVQKPGSGVVHLTDWAYVIVLSGGGLVGPLLAPTKRQRKPWPIALRAVWRVLLGLYIVLAVLLILTLAGIAAGVH